MHPDFDPSRPRNPDLACFSDPMLLDALLDALTAGATDATVPLAREIVARRLTAQVLLRARQRLAPPA